MKTFNDYLEEGKITSTLVKGLGLMLRNKLSRKIQEGKSGKTSFQKMDSIMDALGIVNIVMILWKIKKLLMKSIIVRDSNVHADGILANKKQGINQMRERKIENFVSGIWTQRNWWTKKLRNFD